MSPEIIVLGIVLGAAITAVSILGIVVFHSIKCNKEEK